MVRCAPRSGRTNPLVLLGGVSLVLLMGLVAMLYSSGKKPRGEESGANSESLFMYCAAGMRKPIEQIAADFEQECGVHVQLQYGGSNTLLNQIEVARIGDTYLAADDSYIELAREKGLVDEAIPVAVMRPVIAVAKGNPKSIRGVSDLLRGDVRVALGNPDQAAVGKATRRLLRDSGDWVEVEKHVRENGVFHPTVPEVANAIKIGSVSAGVVWDATVAQYPELEAVRTAEFDAGAVDITIGIMKESEAPATALKFARYAAARDRGLKTFEKYGYEVIDGDVWEQHPEITFFAGSVNRRALEPIIKEFQQREGVTINTVYNGCGILTGQMRTMQDSQAGGFPDVYMACDVYYLETVADLFQDAVNVSNADIVIAVQTGNPREIHSLADLAKPGVRVVLGQPDQCTIGVLSRRLLESEKLYEAVEKNLVAHVPTSAELLIPIKTDHADATLAYATDTRAEPEKVDVVAIDSPLAKAVQPYSIARSSEFKYLGRRLFDRIAQSRDEFEAAGFVWGLNGEPPPETAAAENAPAEGASDEAAPAAKGAGSVQGAQ